MQYPTTLITIWADLLKGEHFVTDKINNFYNKRFSQVNYFIFYNNDLITLIKHSTLNNHSTIQNINAMLTIHENTLDYNYKYISMHQDDTRTVFYLMVTE